MIKKLELSSFRGQSVVYDFTSFNHICGRNGSGKSTIKEAVCFAFTGADSLGKPVPLHFLGVGEDKLKVSATTSKVTLHRTLTRNKFSSLSYEKDGVKTSLNQTELEKMLCSPPLFLSVFSPGAFMRFPAKIRHAILDEITPKADRRAIIQELSGVSIDAAGFSSLDYTRRPDLLANDFANKRRELQGSSKTYADLLTSYESNHVLSEPAPLQQNISYEALKNQFKVWSDYKAHLSTHMERENQISMASGENKRRAEIRASLQQSLEAIEFIKNPEPQSFDAELSELRGLLIPIPQPPAVKTVVDTDHCPTCGQIVGAKHRETVRGENERLVAEYQKEVARVKEENSKVEKKIFDLEARKNAYALECDKVNKKNSKISTERAVLEARIRDLTTVSVPESLPAPTPPPFAEVTYDDVRAAESVYVEHERKVAQYLHSKEVADEATRKTSSARSALADLDRQIEVLHRLESAAKELPAAEFALRQSLLELPGYKFTGEDEVFLVDHRNVPYHLLSTAEQVYVDALISLKINQLMPRKVGMIFFDNAELLDAATWARIQEECAKQGMQWFAVYVESGVENVVVRSN